MILDLHVITETSDRKYNRYLSAVSMRVIAKLIQGLI